MRPSIEARFDRVPLILAHGGCDDPLCALCRSTLTGRIAEVPSPDDLAKQRRARHRRRARSGCGLRAAAPAPVPPMPQGTDPATLRDWIDAQRGAHVVHTAVPMEQADDALDGDDARPTGGPLGGALSAHGLSLPTTKHPLPLSALGMGGRPGTTLDLLSGSCDDVEWSDGDGFYVTGCALGDLDRVDGLFQDWMKAHNVPNAAFALVAGDGRLVVARGYTYTHAVANEVSADAMPWSLLERVEANADAYEVPITTPTSVFRIASIAKLITAMTVMHLLETDDAPSLGLAEPVSSWSDISDAVHPEWIDELRVWHLLGHFTGWRRTHPATRSPTNQNFVIADALETAIPISRADIYEYVSTYSWENSAGDIQGFLRAFPGTIEEYSNLGYMLAADLVTRSTGRTFLSYCREHILDPLGCTATEQGSSLFHQPGEVDYWSWGDITDGWDEKCWVTGQRQEAARNANGVPAHESSIPLDTDCGELPYAKYVMANREGCGGMVSNVIDLARIGWEMSPSARPTTISEHSRTLMKTNWSYAAGFKTRASAQGHGLGLWVNPHGLEGSVEKGGSYAGTRALLFVHGQDTEPSTVVAIPPDTVISGKSARHPPVGTTTEPLAPPELLRGSVWVLLVNCDAKRWSALQGALITATSSEDAPDPTGRSPRDISDWGRTDLWARFS